MLWEIEETLDFADHSLVTVPTGMLQECVDKLFRVMDGGNFCLFVCLFLPCEFCVQNYEFCYLGLRGTR